MAMISTGKYVREDASDQVRMWTKLADVAKYFGIGTIMTRNSHHTCHYIATYIATILPPV